MKLFDKDKLKVNPLSKRNNKLDTSIMINPNDSPGEISSDDEKNIEFIANSMKEARKNKSPIIFAFGAHLVKNGLSKIMIELMKEGYVTHIVANGAVSIHDWEFAYQGKTSEDVEFYLSRGEFGIWEETGKYINGAINENSKLGYGSAVGKLISNGFLTKELISHKFSQLSILGNAYNLEIPVSILPGIGYDIIYTHPDCDGAAIGEASYIDFLKFTKTMEDFLTNGVYISIGSAITSPMVFEKALSMVRNVSPTKGEFDIFVNDLEKGSWDWCKGEPPEDNPDYYLRFMKTFSRAGAKNLKYVGLDNRLFLHTLYNKLK